MAALGVKLVEVRNDLPPDASFALLSEARTEAFRWSVIPRSA